MPDLAPDFIFRDERSFWICTPQNEVAREHLADNVSDEAQWWAGGVVVEARYVSDLATELQSRGFEVAL